MTDATESLIPSRRSYRPPRVWPDLSDEEQQRVKRLLTPDPDDNLDDLIARCERAIQIMRDES